MPTIGTSDTTGWQHGEAAPATLQACSGSDRQLLRLQWRHTERLSHHGRAVDEFVLSGLGREAGGAEVHLHGMLRRDVATGVVWRVELHV
ncbi:MAG TPA: hypothetical protein VMK82_02675, partial [Steroidobacteraceae bacterium]|nr:hypothetical protein [Steroidobacteraceae bacterium]